MDCTMCGSPAVVVVALSDGCVCRPDDREQALCAQHAIKSEPLGTMATVRVLANVPGVTA